MALKETVCDVCGARGLLDLTPPCVHTPQEHAKAAIARVMAQAGLVSTTGVGNTDTLRTAIISGLHRWLEWDFPTARSEYEDGATHVLDAMRENPLPPPPHDAGGRDA